MSNFSLNFWCVILFNKLSVPLPAWQEKKTLNAKHRFSFIISIYLMVCTQFPNYITNTFRATAHWCAHPFDFQLPTHSTRKHYFIWLPLSTATHVLKQKTRRKYIFSVFIRFFEWEVQNSFFFSHLYIFVGCVGCQCWCLEQNYREYNHYYLPEWFQYVFEITNGSESNRRMCTWFWFDINTYRLCYDSAHTLKNWKCLEGCHVSYSMFNVQCSMLTVRHSTTQLTSKQTNI